MIKAGKILIASSAIVAALVAPVFAADLPDPPVIETPIYEAPEVVPAAVGGWYIRGDLGYSKNTFEGADYITYGCGTCGTSVAGTGQLKGSINNSYSFGAGVGYQINHYFRVDTTLDYQYNAKFKGVTNGTCNSATTPATTLPCSSTDTSRYAAITLLANAYVDLGTYAGFTPYVGAGFGGAYVTWKTLYNTVPAGFVQSGTATHEGYNSWRFAYALMLGASYNVTNNLTFDLGYRYKHIYGGKMFKFASNVGPGYDKGITQHQVRAGLRYKFGASNTTTTWDTGGQDNCCKPPVYYK